MKINQIPVETPRVDLSTLPPENELIAISEEYVEAREVDGKPKVGGLIIRFKQRDGKQFPQKYSKISGAALVKAMEKLGIKDTEELQKNWYKYKLTPMRTGYPRYIPIKKLPK